MDERKVKADVQDGESWASAFILYNHLAKMLAAKLAVDHHILNPSLASGRRKIGGESTHGSYLSVDAESVKMTVA